jgi:AcrR family transcriptional regulator
MAQTTPTEGTIPRREARRRETVQAIMSAAHELANEVGYEAMTMDDLAVRAGLSKPTLYSYFRNKQDIWIRALIDRINAGTEFFTAIDPNKPALARLEEAGIHLLSTCYGDAFTAMGPAVRAALIPALYQSDEYQQAYGAMFAALCEFIEDARAEGAIAKGIPTRIAAQVFISLIRDKEYRDYLKRGECQSDRLAQTLVRIVLDGLTPRAQITGR